MSTNNHYFQSALLLIRSNSSLCLALPLLYIQPAADFTLMKTSDENLSCCSARIWCHYKLLFIIIDLTTPPMSTKVFPVGTHVTAWKIKLHHRSITADLFIALTVLQASVWAERNSQNTLLFNYLSITAMQTGCTNGLWVLSNWRASNSSSKSTVVKSGMLALFQQFEKYPAVGDVNASVRWIAFSPEGGGLIIHRSKGNLNLF